MVGPPGDKRLTAVCSHQNQHLPSSEMVHAHPDREAAQANAPREEDGGEARSNHAAGPKEGEGGADPLSHWLDYELQEVKSQMLSVLRRGRRGRRGIWVIECTTTMHGRRTSYSEPECTLDVYIHRRQSTQFVLMSTNKLSNACYRIANKIQVQNSVPSAFSYVFDCLGGG
jgi:hypothetical protein